VSSSSADEGTHEHRLTLVPTPIGNLGDVTLRALEALRSADVVAAEDTRRSRVLLDRYEVTTPLVRLDAHTIPSRAPRLLREHRHVAFVTDAGSPGVSDPGAELVRLALELGVTVEALPGATAFVPALVLSGLPVHRFAFEGFLPRRGRERRARLEAIATRDHTTALYESPNRLVATLLELAGACGPQRRAAVARELTKRFETVERGTLTELQTLFQGTPPRGELVVVVGPAAPVDDLQARADAAPAAPPAAPEALAARLAADGTRGRDLLEALLVHGVPRSVAYRLSVRYKHDRGDAER
jgi:16S rRNA (cytidine1402-2'-O)-methyltransferase